MFQGKEFDMMHGLRWHDHGARFADNTILRWTTMDPLCEKFYDTSPYVFCGNNPLKYVDPNGKEKLDGIGPDEKQNVEIRKMMEQLDDDPNNILIFAHGDTPDGNIYSKSIIFRRYDDKQDKWEEINVKEGIDLNNLLLKISTIWRNYKTGKSNIKPKIIFYSCSSSNIAKKISGDDSFKGVDIIAPNTDVNAYPLGDNKYVPVLFSSKMKRDPEWVTYRNGAETIFNGRYNGEMKDDNSFMAPGTIGFKYEWTPF